jgi:mannose-6-phosphate isomerase-like protein (cupin superfamily)
VTNEPAHVEAAVFEPLRLVSDECFLVVEGALEIDLADDRTVTVRPGELFTIPAGVRHRTRAAVRTVNLCFEHARAYTDVVFEE